MHVFKEIEPLRKFLHQQRGRGASIGLVPTMGGLHRGHMALVRASGLENTITVCSIYVNPTQFNNAEDLAKYPRTISHDIALLEAECCEVVFMPEHAEMYNHDTAIRFDFGNLDKKMEGRFRPGHFNGVALVVSKLFNIVQPDIAYFGQKDYQQFRIVSMLQCVLKIPLHVRSVPTVRAQDGLALSTRNQRLTDEARIKALSFFKALTFAQKALSEKKTFPEIRKAVMHTFERIDSITLEYFELADCEHLTTLEEIASPDRKAILLIAGYVDGVRLIDNMIVEIDENAKP